MKQKYIFNRQSATIDGIEEVLSEAINVSYRNNNVNILFEIINTVHNIINKSIGSGSIGVFEKEIQIIKRLYYLSFSNGEYSQTVRRTVAIRLKDITNHILRINNTETDVSKREILIKGFLKYSLTIFNSHLFDILVKRDKNTYKLAANEFYKTIFDRSHRQHSNIQKEKKEKSDEFLLIERYIDSVAFYQYSWILFLYKNKKITLIECHEFLNENKFKQAKFEYFLDTLFFIRNSSHFDALGTEDWEKEIVERLPNTSYTPISQDYWVTLGMMIYLIKNFAFIRSEVTIQDIRSISNYFSHHFDDFQKRIEEIKDNKEIWIPIVFENNIQYSIKSDEEKGVDFLNRIDNISESLKSVSIQLQKDELIRNNKRINSTRISTDKIISYRNGVGDLWYQRSFLHRLFDKFKNYNESTDNTIDLWGYLGETLPKNMFLDEGYEPVYGSLEFGGRLADSEDGDFLEVIKNESTIKSFDNIQACLNNLIEDVKRNGFNPTTIIIGYKWNYSTHGLTSDENYKSSWENEEVGTRFGLYKNIPIFSSFNEDFDDYIIIADFKEAFHLTQWRNDNWYKKQLKVDIEEINSEKAISILKNNSEYWKNRPNGIRLSDQEAIDFIKTLVLVDIGVKEKFEVKNKKAYSIGMVNFIRS